MQNVGHFFKDITLTDMVEEGATFWKIIGQWCSKNCTLEGGRRKEGGEKWEERAVGPLSCSLVVALGQLPRFFVLL